MGLRGLLSLKYQTGGFKKSTVTILSVLVCSFVFYLLFGFLFLAQTSGKPQSEVGALTSLGKRLPLCLKKQQQTALPSQNGDFMHSISVSLRKLLLQMFSVSQRT